MFRFKKCSKLKKCLNLRFEKCSDLKKKVKSSYFKNVQIQKNFKKKTQNWIHLKYVKICKKNRQINEKIKQKGKHKINKKPKKPYERTKPEQSRRFPKPKKNRIKKR